MPSIGDARVSAAGVGRRPGPSGLRPPKRRLFFLLFGEAPSVGDLSPSPAASVPPASGGGGAPPVGLARVGRGCRWTSRLRADRVTRADRRGGGLRGSGLAPDGALYPGEGKKKKKSTREPPRFAPGSHAPNPYSTTTSDQTRQPAEFKHITKRRKRN